MEPRLALKHFVARTSAAQQSGFSLHMSGNDCQIVVSTSVAGAGVAAPAFTTSTESRAFSSLLCKLHVKDVHCPTERKNASEHLGTHCEIQLAKLEVAQ